MARAIGETNRRRRIQDEYNKSHGITPETVKKGISDTLSSIYEMDYFTVSTGDVRDLEVSPERIPGLVEELTKEMKEAAKKLEFERAAEIRDRIKRLRELEIKYAGEIKSKHPKRSIYLPISLRSWVFLPYPLRDRQTQSAFPFSSVR
jgi:excinuclease UvrABC helicase subunit UvrB